MRSRDVKVNSKIDCKPAPRRLNIFGLSYQVFGSLGLPFLGPHDKLFVARTNFYFTNLISNLLKSQFLELVYSKQHVVFPIQVD